MQGSRVASRYAKSLLELSQEMAVLDNVVKDMELFAKVCKENHSFVNTLKSPIIKNSIKLTILKKTFEGKVNALTIAFFEILSRKKREDYLPEISIEFGYQLLTLKGILSGEVITAIPLNDELRNQFKSMAVKAYGKEVKLKEKTNKDIIGGFVLTVGDQQLDESVKSKLQKIKNKFKDNSYVAKY